MTALEKINYARIELTAETAIESYNAVEAELVNVVGALVVGAPVKCSTYGDGSIVGYRGKDIDNLLVDIDFPVGRKTFSLAHILSYDKFVKVDKLPDIGEVWFEAYTVHKELTEQLLKIKRAKAEAERLALKEAEEEKKLEAKYQATKSRVIRDFEERVNTVVPKNSTEAFYHSLGWMANNCGAFSCALPDYLLPYFQKQFGTTYDPRVVDSKKRTVNGNAMRWAISMTANIKKKSISSIPAFLQQYLNKTGTAVADTSFIWDLVSNYGFQFGKTQDIDQIRATVPTEYITYFETGYAE